MKKYLRPYNTLWMSVLLFLLHSTPAAAQKSDPVLARVRYTAIHASDTLSGKPAHPENMLLFIGKHRALYTSYDKINFEIASEASFRAKMAARVNNGRPVAVIDEEAPAWIHDTTYQYVFDENKWYTRETLAFQFYLSEEKAPLLHWKISPDTANFSGLHCQKATLTFEGKNWIAWFAPELPYPSGPWKLNGLPGLIVEAYDEQQDIAFRFAGIEKAQAGDHVRDYDITKRPDARPDTFNPLDQKIGRDVGSAYFDNLIHLPQNAISTSKKELDRLKAAYKKDPKGFTKALWGY